MNGNMEVSLTIVDTSQAVGAFKALKRFDPALVLGPTLARLRANEPALQFEAEFPIYVDRFEGFLDLVDDLDRDGIAYSLFLTGGLPRFASGDVASRTDIAEAVDAGRQLNGDLRSVAASDRGGLLQRWSGQVRKLIRGTPFGKQEQLRTRHNTACMTGSGWCCLWDAASFEHIVDATTFEIFCCGEAVDPSVFEKGQLVPINDYRDGGYAIELRIGDDNSVTTSEDLQSASEKSAPYRFVSSGHVCVSGVEFVGFPIDRSVNRIDLPPGEYIAHVFNLEDDTEQHFVITLCPRHTDDEVDFGLSDDTFDRHPVLPSGHIGFRVETCDNWRQLKTDTMAATGHDRSSVSVAYKEHLPLYLGNGHQDAARIHACVPALRDVAEGLNCQYHFVLDDERIDADELLKIFPM